MINYNIGDKKYCLQGNLKLNGDPKSESGIFVETFYDTRKYYRLRKIRIVNPSSYDTINTMNDYFSINYN